MPGNKRVTRDSSRPTIRQVAQACGVSPITVSAVLNNKPGQVGPETRQRVLKTVREMGYRPAVVETLPPLPHLATLGVVAGVSGDSLIQPGYYHSILNGILRGADRRGNNVLLFTNNLFHTDTHQSIRIYCDGRCDGLLVIAPRLDSPLVVALQERGIPFVIIGATGGDDTLSSVDVDNVAAGQAATEYLLRQGHERVAFVSGPPDVQSARLRLQGYRQARAAYGLPANGEFVLGQGIPYLDSVSPGSPEGESRIERFVGEQVRVILTRPIAERPTALFCWHDATAIYALRALQSLGIKIPQEMSVIGIDDDPRAVTACPPLTTLRQPYQDLGDAAVEALLTRLRDPESATRGELLPAQMIVRESVALPGSRSEDGRA